MREKEGTRFGITKQGIERCRLISVREDTAERYFVRREGDTNFPVLINAPIAVIDAEERNARRNLAISLTVPWVASTGFRQRGQAPELVTPF